MAKSSTGKRVILPLGEQQKLLEQILTQMTVSEAANLTNLSERTIRDWRRERFSMDYDSLQILCHKANLPIPKNLALHDQYWYTSLGAKKGATATLKKCGRVGGDPEHRKKKWREWWENIGQYEKHPIIHQPKAIHRPRKSADLAEFVGIVLGDGGITKRQITITLHRHDDAAYATYVVALIEKLFRVPVVVHKDNTYEANDYVISRTELVHFCTKHLGLKVGSKVRQQVDIPLWIQNNKEYAVACIRGLIDTDGSMLIHKYISGGKQYTYKKICFTNRSLPILQSVLTILQSIGIQARYDRHYDILIESKEAVKKYIDKVGSHNPKHLKRYEK